MFYAFLRYDGPDTRLISISETHTAESDSWREEDMKKKVVVLEGGGGVVEGTSLAQISFGLVSDRGFSSLLMKMFHSHLPSHASPPR